MRSKRLPGLPVLSISTGTQLGRVRRPLIDAQKRRVVGLTLSTARLGSRKILPMDAIHALGSHAVTVAQPDDLKNPKDDGVDSLVHQQNITVVGSPAITVDGILVGTVQDYAIAQGGVIATLFVTQNLWKTLAGGEISIPGELVIAIGEDAVIVANEVEKLVPAERASSSRPKKLPREPLFKKPFLRRENQSGHRPQEEENPVPN